MKNLKNSLIVAALTALVAFPAMAQQKRISPHETISAVIDKKDRVTIVYGRPYSKDPKSGDIRKIWGGLVPYNQVWRTGADEATLLVTQKAITIGGTSVPAGAYTLFTLPTEDGGKLIISSQIGQWGTQYDEKKDFARVPLKREALDQPKDQFAMSVEQNPAGGGIIKLMWEGAQYSVTFTVND